MYVCLCVCMFGHNSGTPGAISTKLGTHMALCMCKNLMYVLYIYMYYLLSIIFSREDGVGGLHAIHPPQGLPIAAAVTFMQIGIEATARQCVLCWNVHTNMRPFVFRYGNRALQLRCHMTVKCLNFCVSGQCRTR
jgi:hypothetical protein